MEEAGKTAKVGHSQPEYRPWSLEDHLERGTREPGRETRSSYGTKSLQAIHFVGERDLRKKKTEKAAVVISSFW